MQDDKLKNLMSREECPIHRRKAEVEVTDGNIRINDVCCEYFERVLERTASNVMGDDVLKTILADF